jgi:DNA-binding transcriptional ArsR family regulator
MHQDTPVDPLGALGDGSRRAILQLLCERERSVGDIVACVGLSQPAVSQHLRVLRAAALVTARADGRMRYYRAAPDGLARLRAEVEVFWSTALDRMKAELESPGAPPAAPPAPREEHAP